MSYLRFFVLGPVHVEVDGQWLDLGPVRQQAVFATLLFNRDRIVTAEAIPDGVWGDGYRLRLGPAGVDLADLEDAVARATVAEAAGGLRRAALVLADSEKAWTGELLVGLPGPFAQSRRQHLAERRIVNLEHRLDLELRQGDHHAVIPALTALRAEFPLRERIASMLMIALFQTGRQNEAVKIFGRLRTDLMSQLGVEPTPATTRAYVAMLRGEPGIPLAQGRFAGPSDAPAGHRRINRDHVAG